MIRKTFWVALMVCLCSGAASRAQMGMNLFRKPNITDIFKPVVGKGAAYETDKSGTKSSLEMTIVGKESVEGKDAYWMEIAHEQGYAKMLMTKDDFESHRMIVQSPGKPAMEMTIGMNSGRAAQRRQEELDKWHQVGSESITVPAGTFSCQHWQKGDGKGDIWLSEKVSPFGIIKMVDSSQTMTLVKVITDAKDHITGPVQKFDPQALRQMMDQRQNQ